MESIACDLCGSEKNRLIASQADIFHNSTREYFNVVECDGCGFTYTNPRPSIDEISKYYAPEYPFHSRASSGKKIFNLVLNFLANTPLAYLFNWIPVLNKKLVLRIKPNIKDPIFTKIKSSKKRCRVLDIGCGSGNAHFWGAKASIFEYQKYAEVYGIEIDDKSRNILARLGITSYKTIGELDKHLDFDFIRMNWSLEHVHRPSEYFEFISNRLKSDGKAIICVPNYDGILYKISPDCIEVPVHLNHFKKKNVEMYAHKYGLEVNKTTSFSYPGMYLSTAACYEKLSSFGNMSIFEAKMFQRILNRYDLLEKGNDIIFEIEKNSPR